MQPQAIDMREKQAELLANDPGSFDPATAFRVAQHLVQQDELTIGSHNGARPTPVAISGYRSKNGKAELRSAFAPIIGPLGSLPPSYSELRQREERNRSKALTSFFNLFAARFSELFVSATEKYRLARELRWTPNPENNAFRKTLLSLTGFGTTGLSAKVGVKEDVLLRFSGLLANRNRNATALTSMLREFTGLDVTIEQFRRRWVPLPLHEQSRMGQPGGLRLGQNVTAGSAIEDFSGGFRIVLGPVGYADYLALTPGSKRLAEIFAVTRLFVGSAFEFDIQVILKKEDVPFCQLGQADAPARLGWNSWARLAPAAKDSTDAIVTEREGSALSA
ncbi:type VI secretion system baseplate subunit TssG [Agrobacterium rosae]|uniref:Type VI secretion system baseplate subunit TssG n=1 Tax=Agrobacterium rosae TaxID=1972867 RepID=A0AAE5RVJ7_9HYPH|nr:type VI secretion system baseplate subunit TssG [Agrobacterium rosae]KAA3515454.1 type VI secretion system baseplate subunit TssG [Agrobacterium rosae]KAA3524420.1 type VI secretion system baseplate subunit TssG [Agrobacterium rosae]MBN7804283.1 type VI secretion system baseplate subunit TssG [Agrobacterium rosae]MCM2431324.1 type VI secretion system baseplate subunit TssG [Agrobacterium rosae]MDX8312654.1 type VI secretion system baseplate subunit TssG [Agrobacterium rosae]